MAGSNRNLYFAASVACMTAAFFGYSVGFIGGVLVLPSFLHHFHPDGLSPHELAGARAIAVTSWLVGAAVGVVAGMPIYTRLGRKPCLLFCAVLYTVGAVLQAGGFGGIVVFDLGRLINGIGTGAGTLVSPLYISEISTAELRGMLVSGYQVAVQLTALIGFWGAFVANQVIDNSSPLQYQIPAALQLIPGIVLVFGTVLIPEAPRFLAETGTIEALNSSVAWLRGLSLDHEEVQNEIRLIRNAVQVASRRQNLSTKSFASELMTPGLRRRLMVGIGLMIAQNMAGLNAINYYAPNIFQSAGYTSITAVLFLTGLYGVMKLVAALAFMFFCVRVRGNRFWLKLGSAVCCASMLILAVCVSRIPEPLSNKHQGITAEGLIAVIAVFVFSVFYGVSLGPISWNVCGEIFPPQYSAQCCTITTVTQWLFQILVAIITPYMIASLGWMTYLVYGAFCLVSLVWCWAYVPETRDVRLGKAMDELFDIDRKGNISEVVEEVEDVRAVNETTSLLGTTQRQHRRSSIALVV